MNMNKKSLVLAVLGIAALALFPVMFHNPYYLHLAETILIYAILLFGLDIVVGYTGEVSLGHAGLFGIGSYTAGGFFFQARCTVCAADRRCQCADHGRIRRRSRAAGAACDRSLPGHGDAGVRHHRADP